MKKKILNSILILVMLVSILGILTGCGKTQEEKDEDAVQMLEQIYNDNLTCISRGIGAMGDAFGKGSTTKLKLKSERYPEAEITMQYRYNSRTKTYEYERSDYNFLKYKNDLSESLKLIDGIYSGCKIKINNWWLDEDVNYSFNEYMASKNSVEIDIFLPPTANKETRTADAEKLRIFLKNNGFLVKQIDILYTNNQEQFNNVDFDSYEGNIWRDIREDKCIEGSFSLKEDYEWDSEKWNNVNE